MKPSLSTSLLFLGLLFALAVTSALTQAAPEDLSTSPTSPVQVSRSQLTPQEQSFVFFYSKILLNRSKAQVSFAYSFDSPPILWLGFTPQNESDRLDHLISHPQINNLSWPSIKSPPLTLFQQTTEFTSIDTFLENPPPLTQVAIDPNLKDVYPQFDSAASLDNPLDLARIKYILTTYIPSTPRGDVLVYQNSLDTSGAKVNELNQIEWYLRNPLADAQNPYYLGQINVEFLP